jgi:hypothetical protein
MPRHGYVNLGHRLQGEIAGVRAAFAQRTDLAKPGFARLPRKSQECSGSRFAFAIALQLKVSTVATGRCTY